MTICLPLLQTAADTAVRKMLKQWDSASLNVVDENSDPGHVLAYSECLHAQDEMKFEGTAKIADMKSNLKKALGVCALDDTLKFDASQITGAIDLPRTRYCRYDCKRTRSVVDARARA